MRLRTRCINCNNYPNTDKKTIKKSVELDVIIADTDSDLQYKKRIFAMERGPGVAHQILKHGLVGKADKIGERLKKYVEAGVNQFFLAFQDPFDSRALELFADIFRKWYSTSSIIGPITMSNLVHKLLAPTFIYCRILYCNLVQ
ncbi:MAG TPA: hypothetical protein VFS97_10490 [Nitrososphaeraceae archaeon]|nr:hypothetical protein [Nitrososphaeraceae archaeon]